jgi:hypothetical protein
MSEVADTIAALRDRIALPIVVDADNGFGNALNVQRTVRVFERMGANALQLEDQTMPKRCGHLDGKSLISKGEMAGKIRAACDARQSEETLIIGRTDAIAVEGFDAAIDRAEAYVEAGADMLFIEAPQSMEEIHQIVKRFGGPSAADGQHGGRRQDADHQCGRPAGARIQLRYLPGRDRARHRGHLRGTTMRTSCHPAPTRPSATACSILPGSTGSSAPMTCLPAASAMMETQTHDD